MRYGAGILAVCPASGRVLVLQRSALVSDPLTWASPGGCEELFDNGQPRWTAIREFIEETGREPSAEIFPLATIYNTLGPFHLFVSIEPEEFEPVLDWENEAALWLSLDEVDVMLNKHQGFEYALEHPHVRKILSVLIEHAE